jgi:hypothetical protein
MFKIDETQTAEITSSLPGRAHIYLRCDAEALKSANVGNDYGNTFIDAKGAEELWSDVFVTINHIPGGLRGWQDVIVLRKR